ncbi:glycosyltransferase family 4 protein [Algivirga pacifica]|uniref:N-acetyl-alpha-D-glucosaminyl L-malate synthase BshA n=1 Tax=Algivirga pacifica TaxID=1162670 RepID=A0ABP9DMG0_9BACT
MSSIIWLTDNYPPEKGGLAVSCQRIVQNLRKQGVRIHVVHFTNEHPPFEIIEEEGGTYMACEITEDEPHTLNLGWITLKNRIEKESFSHLVAFGGRLPMLAGPVYADWLDVPLITMVRGLEFDQSVFSPSLRMTLRHAFRRSITICAVSKEKVYKIDKMYKGVTVNYTPNGINLSEWQLTAEEKAFGERFREKNEGKRVIGIFGELRARKGIPFFLKALSESPYCREVKLLLVGDLPEVYEQRLGKYRMDYETHEFVPQESLKAYYAACDVIAIPSFYDGMPNILLEAGALGIPVMGSKVDGIEDIVEDGRSGYLFCPASLQDCQKAIQTLMEDTSEGVQEKGRVLQEKIAAEYNDEKETECYLNIFG